MSARSAGVLEARGLMPKYWHAWKVREQKDWVEALVFETIYG